MSGLSLLLWLGITLLYLGFAAVFGVLVRQAASAGNLRAWALASGHAALVFGPASIVVLGLEAPAPVLRLGVFLAGMAAMGLSYRQPDWAPPSMWQVRSGQRYFSIAMAIAAIWALLTIWTQPALGSALIVASAISASASSLTKANSKL